MKKHVLDELGFEGGVVQAVRLEDTHGPARFLLIRNELAMADFVDEGDEGMLYGSTAFETEAELRATFLETMGATYLSHRRLCTGWCGFRIRVIADRVREACESLGSPDFPRWHCHEASVALALALRKAGYQPTVMTGEFHLDKPMVIDPDEPNETVKSAAHWWVEVDDMWVDITADQFQEHVWAYLPAVSLLAAGATGARHVPACAAKTAEYETDDRVQAILASML